MIIHGESLFPAATSCIAKVGEMLHGKWKVSCVIALFFGARKRPEWGGPRRATRKHCVPSGGGGVRGGAGPEGRPGSIVFLRGAEVFRVGLAPKSGARLRL